MAVALLCKIVHKPENDDYKKLSLTLKYLCTAAGRPLILGMDGTNTVSWWADGAFAIHNDMKIHTGAYMSSGIGAAYTSSSKQTLNMRSSTEAEIIAADDIIPQVVWNRYFPEEQGYGINDNFLYQDNHSAMPLKKNGRASSSKQTRHINIKYFSSPIAFRVEKST